MAHNTEDVRAWLRKNKSRLRDAIRANDHAQTWQLLDEENANTECERRTWSGLLCLAIKRHSTPAIWTLLDAGVDPLHVRDEDVGPYSAFTLAAQLGNDTALKLLWPRAPPERHGNDMDTSCLVRAARYGRTSIVSWLLDVWDGWTNETKERALRAAVARWEYYVIDLLLRKFTFEEDVLHSVLLRAFRPKDGVEEDTELGETQGAVQHDGVDLLHQQRIIKRLLMTGLDLNRSPLVHNAVEYIDQVGALQTLLENGVNVDAKDYHGETILHKLASPIYINDTWGNCEARIHETGIRMAIEYGASAMIEDNHGRTPLHCAAFGTNASIFHLYLSQVPQGRVEPALANKHGETLLHYAAAGGNIDVLDYLLTADPQRQYLNARSANGWTPFICALAPIGSKAALRALSTGRLLLDRGAYATVTTDEGWTALHCLAMHRTGGKMCAKLASELVLRGVPVDSPGSFGAPRRWGFRVRNATKKGARNKVQRGKTPLHCAAETGAVAVAKVLLEHNANVLARDASGNTPLWYAEHSHFPHSIRRERDKMIKLLKESGGA
ncbi:ankyrin [Hypomontagnella monticulosa]|nr:ankyrin [Hypomontagnella monticulosa]